MRSRKKKERNIRKIEKYEMRKKLKICGIFRLPHRKLAIPLFPPQSSSNTKRKSNIWMLRGLKEIDQL
jgi:hypothetical protein